MRASARSDSGNTGVRGGARRIEVCLDFLNNPSDSGWGRYTRGAVGSACGVEDCALVYGGL
jgi:hypothetical protein